jgi:hypothetical protein
MAKDNRWIAGWMTALWLSLIALPALSQPQYSTEFLTDIPSGSRGMVSGPEIGERIPDFEADSGLRSAGPERQSGQS